MTKPNEQHQFDLLYMRHNLFEGNTYKDILTDVDVASIYKIARPLRTKKSSEVAFVLKQSIKRLMCLNIQRRFSMIMGQNLKTK